MANKCFPFLPQILDFYFDYPDVVRPMTPLASFAYKVWPSVAKLPALPHLMLPQTRVWYARFSAFRTHLNYKKHFESFLDVCNILLHNIKSSTYSEWEACYLWCLFRNAQNTIMLPSDPETTELGTNAKRFLFQIIKFIFFKR